MTNSHQLGIGLWNPPPQSAADDFFEYSQNISQEATLSQFDYVARSSRQLIENAKCGEFYYKEILQKANSGQPGSYIRLGDADGNVLFSALGCYPALAKYNLSKISQIYFGNSDLMEEKKEFFIQIILDACQNADGIGAPERGSVEKSFLGYGPQFDVRGKCGFRGVYNYFSIDGRANILSRATWTTTWVSRNLLPYLFPLLEDRPIVGFITCYEELPKLVQARCNIGQTLNHIIPMQASIAHQTGRRKGLNGDIGHYPHIFERINDSINPTEPGMIYLVAAGILSKAYCTTVKQRGGIAIDIGSVADVWMNVRSRPGMSESLVERWALNK